MRVKILCPDGVHYVRVSQNGSLDAVASQVSTWETFELETLDDGRFTLRTLPSHPSASQYVRAIAGGGNGLSADRDVANDHEKFFRLPLSGGGVAIRTENQSYWRARNLGGETLDCLATETDSWEAFTIQAI